MDAIVRCRPCRQLMRIIARSEKSATWWCSLCGSNVEIETSGFRPVVTLDKCVDRHTTLEERDGR
jgi:ribosomal protein L37AE/L43A